jgi:aromatic-L-amino-acid decarboxylase
MVTMNLPDTCETHTMMLSPFTMDDQTFRHFGQQVLDLAANYLTELPEQPVYRTMPDEERQLLLDLPLPSEGSSPEDVLAFFVEHILPYSRGQNHPCFAAFVNPAATKISMFAAFLSAVMNTSGAGGDYAAIYVEQKAVRWLMELIGFPVEGSDGQFALRSCALHYVRSI